MDSQQLTQSAIVLLVASVQTISLSSAMISYYKKNNKTKDFIYSWASASVVLGIISMIMSLAAFTGWYLSYIYQIWVVLFSMLTLIMVVLGTVLYKPTSGWMILFWTLLLVSSEVINIFTTYSVIPLSQGPANTQTYRPNQLFAMNDANMYDTSTA